MPYNQDERDNREAQLIQEWIEQCQNGHTRAFAKVVQALRDKVLGFLYRMTQNREWAEDLGQEVFLRAYQRLDSYDPVKAAFTTWLYTLARNLCLDELRKKQLQSVSLRELDEFSIDAETNPRGTALRRETERIIADTVNRLEPMYREVFLLREYQYLSVEEIAQITGCPEGTVKSRLHRARLLLQEKLASIETDGRS